jgi:hypothetical protein
VLVIENQRRKSISDLAGLFWWGINSNAFFSDGFMYIHSLNYWKNYIRKLSHSNDSMTSLEQLKLILPTYELHNSGIQGPRQIITKATSEDDSDSKTNAWKGPGA